MLLSIAALSHIYIRKEIRQAEDRKIGYEKIGIAYGQNGIEGAKKTVREIQKEAYPNDKYRSSAAFFKIIGAGLEKMDGVTIDNVIKVNSKEIGKLESLRFAVNIILSAIFIAGLSITAILGIKN